MLRNCFVGLRNTIIKRTGVFQNPFSPISEGYRNWILCWCLSDHRPKNLITDPESFSNWIHPAQASRSFNSQENFCKEISLSHIPYCSFSFLKFELCLHFIASIPYIPCGQVKHSWSAVSNSSGPTLRENRYFLLPMPLCSGGERSST